jgi:hypothetical protein
LPTTATKKVTTMISMPIRIRYAIRSRMSSSLLQT